MELLGICRSNKKQFGFPCQLPDDNQRFLGCETVPQQYRWLVLFVMRL
jgi:hypothetical protein